MGVLKPVQVRALSCANPYFLRRAWMESAPRLRVWIDGKRAATLGITFSAQYIEMYVHNKRVHCYRHIEQPGACWESCWVDCTVLASAPSAAVVCVGWVCTGCGVAVNCEPDMLCLPCHHAAATRLLKRRCQWI